MDVPLVDINAGVMAKPSGTLRFFAGESSSRVKATTIISPLILPIFEPAPCVPTSGTGLMLTVLGGIAEFERELILQRTGDGRPRAKADGVKFGRNRIDCIAVCAPCRKSYGKNPRSALVAALSGPSHRLRWTRAQVGKALAAMLSKAAVITSLKTLCSLVWSV